MKLHVLILTALIGLAASKTVEDCEKLCDNNSTQMSNFCSTDGKCYSPLLRQCFFDKLQCAIDIGHGDVKVLYTLIDNCENKQPKCDDFVKL